MSSYNNDKPHVNIVNKLSLEQIKEAIRSSNAPKNAYYAKTPEQVIESARNIGNATKDAFKTLIRRLMTERHEN